MWQCRKCGGKILDAEYAKNFYEVNQDGTCGEFIEQSDWCDVKYYCSRCGRTGKHTMTALKRMAKFVDSWEFNANPMVERSSNDI